MCIKIRKHVRVTNNERVAWKVIRHYSRFDPYWHPVFQDGRFRVSKWVKAKSHKYGFNVFVTKRAAIDYYHTTGGDIVTQVKVRKIHEQGKWFKYTVLFAREIYVPRENEIL